MQLPPVIEINCGSMSCFDLLPDDAKTRVGSVLPPETFYLKGCGYKRLSPLYPGDDENAMVLETGQKTHVKSNLAAWLPSAL